MEQTKLTLLAELFAYVRYILRTTRMLIRFRFCTSKQLKSLQGSVYAHIRYHHQQRATEALEVQLQLKFVYKPMYKM